MSKVTKELSKVNEGATFEVAGYEFIKFSDRDGETIAVSKDCIFRSVFGNNNNLKESDVLKKLEAEVLPKLAETIGMENICDIKTDLTTLDGLKPYGEMTSKISLPTFDFCRENVHIFDKYKTDCCWWLATPESAQPHSSPFWIVCVSPSGYVNFYGYGERNNERSGKREMTEHERLTELIDETGMVESKSRCSIIASELLANGVIVPHCRVGDTVYYVSKNPLNLSVQANTIYEAEVVRIVTTSFGTSLVIQIHNEYGCTEIPDINEWGKTVFHTKEEAEQALRKEDEGK